MNEKIIGRKEEYRMLQKCIDADTSQLIIVYGRRRVGKTFLINRFFGGRFDFKLTGSYGQSTEFQLKSFINELNMHSGKKNKTPENWTEAFLLLREYLSSLDRDEKHVIFLDEMPWLDTPRCDFLPAFEYFWNSWGASADNIVCIVCGSATSWLVDNIARNKGGLYNRQTLRLYIEPFTLGETEEYLKANGFNWSRYDIVETYMIMGGIPYYLSQLDNTLTHNANIDNIFFRKRALLWDEFDHLYATLFKNSDQYLKVIAVLEKKKSGLTRGEIAKETKLAENGNLTKILDNLVSSEFVRELGYFAHKKQDRIYQLCDYFTLFYYRFLKNNPGADEHFWSNTLDFPARRAWAGLTFEQVAMDHITQIKRKLGISSVLTEISSWFTKGDDVNEGAQIDMLIDRRDRVINICEIKFASGEYTIDKDYEKLLRRKVERFRECSDTKKALELTLITPYGVKENMHSSVVQSQVTMDDFFS